VRLETPKTFLTSLPVLLTEQNPTPRNVGRQKALKYILNNEIFFKLPKYSGGTLEPRGNDIKLDIFFNDASILVMLSVIKCVWEGILPYFSFLYTKLIPNQQLSAPLPSVRKAL
jgi:hypothetical protein